MASSSIQQWAIMLSAYNYTIRYKPGRDLGNADALSRLPSATTSPHVSVPEDLVMVNDHLSSTSVNASSIKEWTIKDPLLSSIVIYLRSGWPDQQLDKEYQPNVARKNELDMIDGCLLWSSRVIIPPPGRELILQDLHETSWSQSDEGSSSSYVWWTGMDAAIKDRIKSCPVCQESRPSPVPAPLHPWEWPSQPWSHIHLDFAGPFLGHYFLVIVDAHSKWLDVHIMASITSSKTIEKLRIIFANHGLPRKVVTDNGPSFTSEEFREFLSDNGIVRVTTSPYHSSSNELAERAVQTFKKGIKHTAGKTIQDSCSYTASHPILPQVLFQHNF